MNKNRHCMLSAIDSCISRTINCGMYMYGWMDDFIYTLSVVPLTNMQKILFTNIRIKTIIKAHDNKSGSCYF